MLQLNLTGEGRYEAPHALTGAPGMVFGGQLLAQAVVAVGHQLDGKPLSSMHTVFSRPVRLDAPILIDVEVLQRGRSATSATVAVHQGGASCARALALALAPQEPELAQHWLPMPDVGGPEDSTPLETQRGAVELRVVGDVQLDDERGGFRPEMYMWARARAQPDVPDAGKAMLAFAGESYFVAAALRPHEGLSQSDAFTKFAPAVVSHGVAYHGAVDCGEWWLFALSVPQFAAGRLFGRGDVFTEDGRLAASIWQENLMRALPASG